jgi:transcriptional regulator NrdR family protein
VIDTRHQNYGIRRRIKCDGCGHKWTTREILDEDASVRPVANILDNNLGRLANAAEQLIRSVKRLEAEVYEKIPEPRREAAE